MLDGRILLEFISLEIVLLGAVLVVYQLISQSDDDVVSGMCNFIRSTGEYHAGKREIERNIVGEFLNYLEKVKSIEEKISSLRSKILLFTSFLMVGFCLELVRLFLYSTFSFPVFVSAILCLVSLVLFFKIAWDLFEILKEKQILIEEIRTRIVWILSGIYMLESIDEKYKKFE
jgi:hypothetical protein